MQPNAARCAQSVRAHTLSHKHRHSTDTDTDTDTDTELVRNKCNRQRLELQQAET
jgi:hypothetical protein